jgi:hypothetical protein
VAPTGLLYQSRMIGDGDCGEKLVEWRLTRKTEVLGENLPQRHFAYHKSHMTRPGFEPGPPRWEASGYNRLSYGAAHSTYLLTELNTSWEAVNCVATQELSNILWKPNVHRRVHKSLPLVPIVIQIDTEYLSEGTVRLKLTPGIKCYSMWSAHYKCKQAVYFVAEWGR